jgi:hypothetical protein
MKPSEQHTQEFFLENHGSAFRLPEVFTGGYNRTGIFLRRKKANQNQPKALRGDCMPTSKKQMTKLNQVKKAKAEELSKLAAAGSEGAKKKLKKLEKKLK